MLRKKPIYVPKIPEQGVVSDANTSSYVPMVGRNPIYVPKSAQQVGNVPDAKKPNEFLMIRRKHVYKTKKFPMLRNLLKSF